MTLSRPARCAVLALCAASTAVAHAEVKLAKVLGDHMVLQRERAVPIWGTADAGEQVTVTFNGKTATATADSAGHWQAAVATGPASNKPADLTIAGKNTVQLHDILVGEVWICSGQSNMEYPLNRSFLNGTPPPPAGVTDVSTQEYQSAHIPEIRTFKVERNSNQTLVSDGWHECGGVSLEHFSAIGYFFGKELHNDLAMPIGLIQSAYAGSRIEPWMSPEAYAKSDVFKADAAKNPAQLDGSPVGNYYTRMVAPLAPFAVRGVLWYQGESNVITTNDGMRYRDKFESLVTGWRAAWHNPDMTFLQVQIAPYAYSKRKDAAPHPITALPELWEAQQAATQIPGVGLVYIHDLGDSLSNIHPWNKWDVGRRLAAWALAHDYGRKEVVWSGPVLKSVTYANGKAVVAFDHVEKTLLQRDGKATTDFEIAGADGNFVHARVEEIKGNTVTLSGEGVAVPAAVRLGWNEASSPNLMNQSGLPVAPFRTDGPLGKK